MACCNPFFYRITNYNSRNHFSIDTQPLLGYQIPCGYCLNCRVDKRNMWSDRCMYELCTKLSASFVTLTYDDVHLYEKMVVDPSSPDDAYLPTLDYSDVRKYINRLRMKIKRLPKEQHNVLCNPDFSYIYVGEYGENGSVFDRPHFHILFFGLDFALCRKLFVDEWYGGIVDVLPVLDGAINYVLKYLDKQLFGVLAQQKYDFHGIARPKRCASVSFGSGLYKSKVHEAVKNNWTYQVGHVRRPFPKYYRDKFVGTDIKRLSIHYDSTLNNQRYRFDMRHIYNLRDTSGKALQAFKLRQSQLRERKLRQFILNDGVGVLDYVSKDYSLYYSPERHTLKSLDTSIQSWLQSEYIEYCKDKLA